MPFRHEQGPIWPGYADLMTSLFGVMLVLFVLRDVQLTAEARKNLISAQKWQKVQEIDESVRKLADEQFFVYQKEYKRHVFRQEVQFEARDATIPETDYQFLEEAGKKIARLISDLKSHSDANIKYLIIIEGMASKDSYANNFELSYQRALALYKFWQQRGIAFDDSICEVIIAGSGTEGVGRYGPTDERRNQRFLIQILPKVGAEGWGSESTAPGTIKAEF